MMETGIFKDLDFGDYLRIPAISNSRLSLMARSPRHYQANLGMDEKAKHLVLGSLIHAGRLEPMSIAEHYAVMPAFELDEENQTRNGLPSKSKTTVYYKDKSAEFERVNEGKTVVRQAWFDEAKAVVGALCECEPAQRLLNGPGQMELTLVWEDPETGLLCKARMDRAVPKQNAFVDLKTTADLLKFPRSIADYGYHRQMAHYQAGWAALNEGEVLKPWIVACEKLSPYCVQSAPMDDEALYAGYQERTRLMTRLAECIKDDYWPGPESPKSWRIPEWAMAKQTISLKVGGKEVTV